MNKISLVLLTFLILVPSFALLSAKAATPESIVLKPVGQVGGPTQAIVVEGNYAYVGVGLRMVVLDVSDPGAMREVGTTQPFEGFVESIAVAGTTAYIACGAEGLYLVDISNPTRPTQVAMYDSPGYAEGVAIAGQHAYVADGWGGLRVVDISDPSHPAELGYVHTLGYAFDVAVAGNYAYVAGAGAGLRVVDISDPVHPSEVGSCDTPGYAHDVAVVHNIAYIADEWEGLRVVDVSEPTSPIEVGCHATPGQAFGVTVADSKVYVADAFAGLRVVDVSNPATPTEVGAYEVKGHAGQVAVARDIAYMADRNWGLRAVDVSNPAHPTQVGFYGPLGYAHDVAVAGNYAYVAAAYYGLRVVDISDLSHPIQIGVYDTPGYTISVAVAGNYAYVATMHNGLHVVDVSDPTQPTKVGFCDGGCRDMDVVKGIAYLANEDGLVAIDVSDPTHPTQLGFIELHEFIELHPQQYHYSCAIGVAVSGNLAYVAVECAGLKIVDVSDPSNPKLIGATPHFREDYAQEVAVADHYAYMATGDGLRVVNVSDPAHPAIVGFYDTPGEACGIVMSGDTAYVAGDGGGLQVVDVSDPSNPTLAGSYNTPGYAHKVTVVGNHVYVADGNGGMLILEASSNNSIAYYEPTTCSEILGELDGKADQVTANYTLSLNIVKFASSYPATLTCGASSSSYHVEGYSSQARLVAHRFDGTTGLAGSYASYSSGTILTVTSAADSGPRTLRWCLENAVSGDTIVFDSSVFPPRSPVTITLSEELPSLTHGNITIDASDAGVILDGSELMTNSHGFSISSDGNVIRGLQILHFPHHGVSIGGGAKNNIIGGDRMQGSGPLGEGNVISGNGGNGIYVGGDGSNNVIVGNFIGVDATGMRALGNRDDGVMIRASHNRIGGNGAGERNIISGNGRHGVSIADDSAGNSVIGNYIGTDASGTADLGNEGHGVGIEIGAFNNLIERNLISGNGRCGVLIYDWGSSYNTVIGNLIGTDASGTLPIPNWCGVGIGGEALFNRIGGTTAEERNIISGNGMGFGIGRNVHGNLVMGNFIGTDINGTSALGNAGDGISAGPNSGRVFIGGMTEGERNVISGNGGCGVHLPGSGTDYYWVAGNYIGTDVTGTAALGNGSGVSMYSAAYNVIQGNLIANNEEGICISYAADNIVFHNSLDNRHENGSDNTGTNFWDFDGEGNYWSDYREEDEDSDGIGDTPHPVPPSGVDNYPLMKPYQRPSMTPYLNQPPDQPVNASPADDATGVSLIPTLESSAFSDPDSGDSPAASQWQLTTGSGDYSTPVFEGNADTANHTSITIPSETLRHSTTYYWRVRHRDNHCAWSSWSEETSFTTQGAPAEQPNQPPNQPSNISPANGATHVSLAPTLGSSAFSDPDSGDSHVASQWQMTHTAGEYSSPVYDSGTDTLNLTSITIASGALSHSTTYYWRVRHQDSQGTWSRWSHETSFATASEAAPSEKEAGGQQLWIFIAVGVAIVIIGGAVVWYRLVRR